MIKLKKLLFMASTIMYTVEYNAIVANDALNNL